jgi:hypothetical protein
MDDERLLAGGRSEDMYKMSKVEKFRAEAMKMQSVKSEILIGFKRLKFKSADAQMKKKIRQAYSNTKDSRNRIKRNTRS